MDKIRTPAGDRKSRTAETLVRLASWSGAWIMTTALATFGPEFLWNDTWMTAAAILINLFFGIGMLRANIHYLNVLDEVMRKVQLHAMGISLGVAVVAGLSYSLLDITNLISTDAEIGHLVIVIAISYIVSLIIGVKRYR